MGKPCHPAEAAAERKLMTHPAGKSLIHVLYGPTGHVSHASTDRDLRPRSRNSVIPGKGSFVWPCDSWMLGNAVPHTRSCCNLPNTMEPDRVSRAASSEASERDVAPGEDEESPSPTGSTAPRTSRTSRTRQVRYDDTVSRQNLALLSMRREIAALQRRRDELAALHAGRSLGSGRREYVIGVTKAYYAAFCRGIIPMHQRSIDEYMDSRVDHQAFTYGSSSDDGVGKLMEQWRLYTRFFPSLRVSCSDITHSQLVDPDTFPGCDGTMTVGIVTVRGCVSGVVSYSAIASVAPHILLCQSLMSKLLNKDVELPALWRFYFNIRGQIIRVDFDCDFMGGFGAIDGVGLLDLVAIMSKASISENSVITDLHENI